MKNLKFKSFLLGGCIPFGITLFAAFYAIVIVNLAENLLKNYSTPIGYIDPRAYFFIALEAFVFLFPILAILSFIITPLWVGKKYGSEFRFSAFPGSACVLFIFPVIVGVVATGF